MQTASHLPTFRSLHGRWAPKCTQGCSLRNNANPWVLSASSYTAPMHKAKPFQEVQLMVKADVWIARENNLMSREISLEFMTNIQADKPRIVTLELRINESPPRVWVYVCARVSQWNYKNTAKQTQIGKEDWVAFQSERFFLRSQLVNVKGLIYQQFHWSHYKTTQTSI